MKGLFTQEQYIEILRARERLRVYKDSWERYPTAPEIEALEYTPPIPEYYLGGRMAYLEHEVDSLKKGYHTHKKRTSSTPPLPSTLYSNVALEENSEDDTYGG